MRWEDLKVILITIATVFVLSTMLWGAVSLNTISKELRQIDSELDSIEYDLSRMR